MIKVCGTRCVRHHSSLLHFTLGLFGPCHNKSHNGEAGIAGCSCQGYCCPAGLDHYSSRAAAPAAPGPPTSPAGSRSRSCPAHPLLSLVLLLPLLREKNKPHQIGRGKGNKMVHVRCWNKNF